MSASTPPPIPVPAIPAASADPLSAAHLAELALAQQNYRPVRRAAGTARFSAVTTLCIGVCSVLFVLLSPDVLGIVIALALCAIGTIEWIGAGRLLRAEPNAGRFLMRNQLAFLALIASYCIIQMTTVSVTDLKNQALPPDVRAELAAAPEYAHLIDTTVEQWGPLAHNGFYGLVLIMSIAFQGGLARYYAVRNRRLEQFRTATPQWARQVVSGFAS